MFSFFAIANGRSVKLESKTEPKVGKQKYHLTSTTNRLEVEIAFDCKSGRFYTDIWRLTNLLRSELNDPEVTIISSTADGFTFYDLGFVKVRPLDSAVTFNEVTQDLTE